jgi:hypothetical protein
MAGRKMAGKKRREDRAGKKGRERMAGKKGGKKASTEFHFPFI